MYQLFVNPMVSEEDKADSTERRMELLHLRTATQVLSGAREDITEIYHRNTLHFRISHSKVLGNDQLNSTLKPTP